MSNFFVIAYVAILVLIWIIAGGFVTQANVKLTSYKNTDQYLHRAYWTTFWAAFITWTLVGILLILMILAVFGLFALFSTGVGEVAVEATETSKEIEIATEKTTGVKPKKSKKYSSIIIFTFLVVAFILTALTGILAAIATSSINKSPNFDINNSNMKKAYDNCLIAAIMCLVTTGFLVVGIIVYTIIYLEKKKQQKNIKERQEKEKEKEKELELKKREELVESLAKIKEQQIAKKLAN